jgi:hypothetical protein
MDLSQSREKVEKLCLHEWVECQGGLFEKQ